MRVRMKEMTMKSLQKILTKIWKWVMMSLKSQMTKKLLKQRRNEGLIPNLN